MNTGERQQPEGVCMRAQTGESGGIDVNVTARPSPARSQNVCEDPPGFFSPVKLSVGRRKRKCSLHRLGWERATLQTIDIDASIY